MCDLHVMWISIIIRQVSKDCDLVRPLSVSNIFSFLQGNLVAKYFYFLAFLSFLSFLKSRVLEGSFPARCDQFN